MGPYNGKNFRCKIGPGYWFPITWNAFWHPPLHMHLRKWTLQFSPFVAYENPYLNLNYSKTSAASPVIIPTLLEINARCYTVGKYPAAALLLRRQKPLTMRQSAKINIFCANVYTIWKCRCVTYSNHLGNFSQYASHVFTDHSQMSGFRYKYLTAEYIM